MWRSIVSVLAVVSVGAAQISDYLPIPGTRSLWVSPADELEDCKLVLGCRAIRYLEAEEEATWIRDAKKFEACLDKHTLTGV